MTETRRWLDVRSQALLRVAWIAIAGFALAALGGGLAVGVMLGHGGVYRAVPVAALLVWLVALVVTATVLQRGLRWRAPLASRSIAYGLEGRNAWRRGSVWAVAERSRSGSEELFTAADDQMARQLLADGMPFVSALRQRTRTAAIAGVGSTLVALAVLLAARPGQGLAADFWHPLSLAFEGPGAVVLSVDRDAVQYGDSVNFEIEAPGALAADFWTREPGEAWRRRLVTLDSTGLARVTLGPLSADLFALASVGPRESDTLHVAVELPVFLVDVVLTARFPAYLSRAAEPIQAGPDTVWVPDGTVIETDGRLSAGDLESAAWRSAGRAVDLETRGAAFTGALRATRTGTWELSVVPEGRLLDDAPPRLTVGVVPDMAPTVTIAIPASDTTIPVSLRQLLVVDLQDDYGLGRAEVVLTKRSRLGLEGDAWTESLELGPEPTDRVVASQSLDLKDRALVPGDTVRLKVRAADRAPVPHWGESREIVLRIPSLGELREQLRREAAALAADADTLQGRQDELSRETEALAAERQRDGEETPPGQTSARPNDELDFREVERAQAVAEEQEAVLEQTEELQRNVEALQEALEAAGVTDAEWRQQLEDIRKLLERAVTPELAERLQELREALNRLDERQVRRALERLAEEQGRLEEELERNRELLERAALEGDMATLAQDAEELAADQERWNEQVEANPDSSAAAQEELLAQEADSLAARLDELSERLGAQASDSQQTRAAESGDLAQQAAEQMRQAAQSAQNQQGQQAKQQGEQARQTLSQLPQDIREQGEQLADQFRQEVLDAMDRSLAETARLAQAQEDLAERMRRGDVGADARRQQAAIEEGVEQLLMQMQEAGGKNALVSPEISAALARAQQQMAEARDFLERASPDGRQAGEMANRALDALMQAAYRLLRSRGNVAGAESGSGLAEALEQMAELARQQGGLNQQAGDLLSLMPTAGQGIQERMRELAAEQRSLGQELEQLSQEGLPGQAEELANEAEQIAEEMERGRLDPALVERQEELFRRLLDAGRSLEGEDLDPERDRESETARGQPSRVPDTDPRLGQHGVRYPFPSWEQLEGLTPEQRRIVLDYFRRLNDATRRP